MKFDVGKSGHPTTQFLKRNLGINSRNFVRLFAIPVILIWGIWDIWDTINSFLSDGIQAMRLPRSDFHERFV